MYKFINRFFHCIILIFFPLAFICSSDMFIKKYNNYSLISVLAIIIITLMALFYLKKDDKGTYLINEKQFIIAIIFIAMFIRALEILIIKTPPVSDFSTMYNGALRLLNGDFGLGLEKNAYWYRWNYQLGFTFYEFLVLKIFNTQSIMVLKALNVVWTTGTIFLSYKIAKKIFGQATARVSAIFVTLYIPYIFSTSVLTNQHLSTFFILLAFYVLVNKNECKFKYFIVGLCIALGHLMRPVAPIYLTAILIYIIVSGLYNKNMLKKTFLNIAKVGGTYLVILYLVSFLFISLGMTNRMLNNQALPTWKFLVGTNYESTGRIGDYEKDLMQKLYREWDSDYDRFNEVSKDEIINRIKDDFPIKICKLLYSKFYRFWGYPDSIITYSTSKSQDTKELFYYYLYGDYLIAIGMVQIGLLYLLGAIGVLHQFINKKSGHKSLLLIIPLSGYIAVHLLVEIQTRYRYSIMPIIMILAAYGFTTGVAFIKSYMSKKNNKVLKIREHKIIKIILRILCLILILSIFKYHNGHELKIKNVNVNHIDNKYMFSVDTSYKDDNLSYAWYIYKDGNDYEKIWYSKNKLLIKDITEDGQYMVKCFVKNSNDKIVSSNSDVFSVDTKNNKELAIEYVDKFMLDDNKYIFIVKPESTETNLLYAWYIYKDGNIYEKIWYSNNNILEKVFNESGKYRIQYFVKNSKGDMETRYFEEIIIE